eukprot:scaffold8036_cov99-Skeletonema_marinoi.AAC.2
MLMEGLLRVPAMRWFVASTWDMSKDVIDMACDESRWELHAEVISHVHRCIYSFVDGKSKESNVHVSSAWRGFGFGHSPLRWRHH